MARMMAACFIDACVGSSHSPAPEIIKGKVAESTWVSPPLAIPNVTRQELQIQLGSSSQLWSLAAQACSYSLTAGIKLPLGHMFKATILA